MSNLEELIRDVAKRGELTHLSLLPRRIEQGDNKFINGWGASFSPATSTGNIFAEDVDPVAALKTAIEEAKLRRRATFEDGEGAVPPKPEKPKKRAAPQADLSDIGL